MPFDALVVLGCRVVDGQLTPAALRRVEQAARTYREQGAELVIASGGKAWQGSLEAEVFARALEARGVPSARLLQERESLTTRGNARGVARLLQGRGAIEIGIVTCDWHLPRALRLFRAWGLEVRGVPAISPARPLHRTVLRAARELASSTLDLWLARGGTKP